MYQNPATQTPPPPTQTPPPRKLAPIAQWTARLASSAEPGRPVNYQPSNKPIKIDELTQKMRALIRVLRNQATLLTQAWSIETLCLALYIKKLRQQEKARSRLNDVHCYVLPFNNEFNSYQNFANWLCRQAGPDALKQFQIIVGHGSQQSGEPMHWSAINVLVFEHKIQILHIDAADQKSSYENFFKVLNDTVGAYTRINTQISLQLLNYQGEQNKIQGDHFNSAVFAFDHANNFRKVEINEILPTLCGSRDPSLPQLEYHNITPTQLPCGWLRLGRLLQPVNGLQYYETTEAGRALLNAKVRSIKSNNSLLYPDYIKGKNAQFQAQHLQYDADGEEYFGGMLGLKYKYNNFIATFIEEKLQHGPRGWQMLDTIFQDFTWNENCNVEFM